MAKCKIRGTGQGAGVWRCIDCGSEVPANTNRKDYPECISKIPETKIKLAPNALGGHPIASTDEQDLDAIEDFSAEVWLRVNKWECTSTTLVRDNFNKEIKSRRYFIEINRVPGVFNRLHIEHSVTDGGVNHTVFDGSLPTTASDLECLIRLVTGGEE